MLNRLPFYFGTILLFAAHLVAQQIAVDGHIDVPGTQPGEVVVWLEPSGQTSPTLLSSTNKVYRLVQENHEFSPHLLVVPVGTRVEFPNRDLVFHNVFSLFEGRRFDLGLYEAGTSKGVIFDRPGVSYIFCNIHKGMSAVVIALDTKYFSVRQRNGVVNIDDVPYGKYTLHIWAEGADPEALLSLDREITVNRESHSLGSIALSSVPLTLQAHKNKYGMDYRPETPENPAYP